MQQAIIALSDLSWNPTSDTDTLNSLCRRINNGFICERFCLSEHKPDKDNSIVSTPIAMLPRAATVTDVLPFVN